MEGYVPTPVQSSPVQPSFRFVKLSEHTDLTNISGVISKINSYGIDVNMIAKNFPNDGTFH